MRAYTLRALALVLLFLTACGSGAPPASAPCAPECRSGFVCVLGECVSACNPPCARGLLCSGSGSTAACVPEVFDAGTDAQGISEASSDAQLGDSGIDAQLTDSDAGSWPDAPDALGIDAPNDAPNDALNDALRDAPNDAPNDALRDAPRDVPTESVMDAPGADATATDATIADLQDTSSVPVDVLTLDASRVDRSAGDATAPVHCGNPGETCCVAISCFPGSECINDRCVAIARGSAECDHPGVCPAGYACVGPQFCGERTCFVCGASRGTVGFGLDCTSGAMCASAVCDRGRCSVACTIGSTGDSECASRAARWICAQRIYGVGRRDGSPEPAGYVTLGSCAQSCARNSDCTAGRACVPSTNFLTDHINFICNVTTRTGTAGMPCERPEQCQSGLCIPGVLPMGAMGCTAPCVVNDDCPAAAPVCERLQLITPGGVFQTIRGCMPSM